MDKTYTPVTTAQELTEALAKCRAAQEKFATYTQEQVDKIFLAAATAANQMRIPLAKQAVAETGMGVVEDKVIKNHYAAEYIYNAYKDSKTCGVIEEDTAYGIQRIAEPIGVIAAVIPTTNPTSTAIFKTLISLKTRNGIESEGLHHRRRSGGAGSGGRRRRAGRHHRVDRQAFSGADQSGNAGGRPDPRHRRSRHGEGSVFLRQARSGRRPRQHPRRH